MVRWPVWSPDGAKIAFCATFDQDEKANIYVMNADGSNVQQLTNIPESESKPDWTAFSYAVEPAGKMKATWGRIKNRLFSRWGFGNLNYVGGGGEFDGGGQKNEKMIILVTF